MKYNIEFEKEQEEDSGYINIPIVEDVISNEAFGDQIGISEDDNVLWLSEDIDIDDEDINEFIRENFVNRAAVKGFLRRIL